ncbi:MAG: SAM-dependent methyltransferase, partial [Pseudomonadota bacterium]
MTFKDHFSQHAGDYARYRPDYPEALFAFLTKSVTQHELAWDCGTGNGQAALGLAGHFDRVIATDPSQTQI